MLINNTKLILEDNMKKYSGFTLVELAIVLVIIGLLVGGILAGRELVEQSKIRKIMNKINDVNLAASTFKLKYNSLPGDFKGATALWGATDCPWHYTQRTDKITCNGDGDGIINQPTSMEIGLFWEHLQNAELVNQNFPNIEDNGDFYSAYETHVDKLNIGVSGTIPNANGNAATPESRIMLGGKVTDETAFLPKKATLLPSRAYAIDSKLDDGRPESGNVYVNGDHEIGCKDESTPPNYDLANETDRCALVIKSAF